MKKYFFSFLIILFAIELCKAQDKQKTFSENSIQHHCGTSEYMKYLMTLDPTMEAGYQKLNDRIDEWMKNNPDYKPKSVITIPVVVHIVYNDACPEQNITDDVVQEQIDVLNSDFAGLNSASMQIFSNTLKANTGIQFCLAQRDPNNNPSTGIERRQTTHGPFTYNDDVKHSSTGGMDQWNPDRFFNIWVCDMDNGLGQGYAYDPVEWPLPDVYGATVDYACFGITSAVPPWNYGHMCTHEVGHSFHLAHIWGDDQGGTDPHTCSSGNCCGGTDHCDDTPNQSVATQGHHSGLLTDLCSSSSPGIMYMNFMDYSYDEDLANFTPDQKSRMQYFFIPGHYLNMLANSDGCLPPCNTCAPIAKFTASETFIPFMLDTVKFYDQSVYFPTSWAWSFFPSTITYTDGTNANSQNPKVLFSNIGFYSVTLTATNAFGSDVCSKTNYINNGVSICDSVMNPAFSACADSLTCYTAPGGYLTGNNGNGNLEVAQKFDFSTMVPSNEIYITNVFVRAVVKGALAMPNFTYVKIYSVGTISNAPEDLIGTSQPLSLTSLTPDIIGECIIPYGFYPFVEIPSDIYISVVFPNTVPTDTLAVLSTYENCYSYDTISAWEKWSDQSWHTLGSWCGDNMKIDLAISLNTCSDVVVGTDEIASLNNVNVYPNPAEDIITVDFGNFQEKNPDISIYNITGKLVKKLFVAEGKNSVDINLSDLEGGIYILYIQSEQNAMVKKLSLIR